MIPLLLFVLLLPFSTVLAITFNLSTPTQCGPLTVSWEGAAQGALTLLIMPAANFSPQSAIQNMTIPPSSSSPYTLPTLPQPAGLQFLASLIDPSGFSSTGTTELLTVGSPTPRSPSCLSTTPDPDFFFFLDPTTNPTQCGTLGITWEDRYTLPASIVGLVPGGTIFLIHTIDALGQGGAGFDWKVDLRGGMGVVVYMVDSGPVGSGGSSQLLQVQGSGDESCITSSSPTTIDSSAPQSTGAGGAGAGNTTVTGVGGGGGRAGGGSSSSSSSSGHSSKLGPILGGVLGGLLLLLLILLLLFLLKRRRQEHDPSHPRTALFKTPRQTGEGDGTEKRRASLVDLLSGEKRARGEREGELEPGLNPGMGVGRTGQEPRGEEEGSFVPSPYPSGTGVSAAQRYERASGHGDRDSFPRTSEEGTSGRLGSMDFGPRLSGPGPVHAPGSGSGSGSGGMGEEGRRSRRSSTVHPNPIPSSPLNSSLGVAGGRSNSTRKRRVLTTTNGDADDPDGEDEQPEQGATRFVLHEDAGRVRPDEPVEPSTVVEMPPRYDQLRA